MKIKRVLKIILVSLAGLLAILILIIASTLVRQKISSARALNKSESFKYGEVPTLTDNGFTFRDLNKNGRLDPYEDSRRALEERVEDLLGQMTLEEKAGTMFINAIGMNKDGSLADGFSLRNILSASGTSEMLFLKRMNHFNIFLATETEQMAQWYNNLQKLAERTRLGIPVTIASDPRNHYSNNPLAAGLAGAMTRFPEPIGLAAMHDSAAMAEFADIARQEYSAVGIRIALHPQIDLATEPRWWRISGSFGEDALLASVLTTAYIKGFQGDSIGQGSVACMTKHWPGGGPQKKGWDAHFEYGKEQVYPGDNFNYHLLPFEAAFRAGTAMIMPYYGIPVDQTEESVGMSYNREIIQGLLREHYGYEGVVCTDWSLIHDNRILGFKFLAARDWGMEEATPGEKVLKILEAGTDQFGGESCPELVVQLVENGNISMKRIDISVRRILRLKFEMGLFDHPFTDVENAVRVVGNSRFKAAAALAHRKSMVLLKNDTIDGIPLLPLKKGVNIYLKNVEESEIAGLGNVVKRPEDADVAILRLQCPTSRIKGGGLLGMVVQGGDLDFQGKEKKEILDLLTRVPTIVDITLSRPAVIPEISAASGALIGSFSSPDDALLDVVFGNYNPGGKLPFELPSSMEAVNNQLEDVPYDSEEPLYEFGSGLSYR